MKIVSCIEQVALSHRARRPRIVCIGGINDLIQYVLGMKVSHIGKVYLEILSACRRLESSTRRNKLV